MKWEERGIADKLRRPDPTHNGPMTVKQGKYLYALCEKHGHDFNPRLTARQASELIDELRSDDLAFEMKGNRTPRFAALEVMCPECRARRLQPCIGRSGPRKQLHAARYAAAQR